MFSLWWIPFLSWKNKSSNPECTSIKNANFLSQLVSIGIYNFTTNTEGVKYLIKKSNTYNDVANIHQMGGGGPVPQSPVPVNPNDYNEIDVGPYLTVGSDNTVKIYVSMDTGGSANTEASKTWTVTATRITLTWDYNFATTLNSTVAPLVLNWDITGGSGIEKTTHIIFDGKHEFTDVTSGTGRRSITIDPT